MGWEEEVSMEEAAVSMEEAGVAASSRAQGSEASSTPIANR
jgi:hypothetical protein